MSSSRKEIEIINRIRNSLSGEERQVFDELTSKAIKSTAHDFLKLFVSKYDPEDSLDNLLSSVGAQVIKNLGEEIIDHLKLTKEAMRPAKAAEITAKILRKIADGVEDSSYVLKVVK